MTPECEDTWLFINSFAPWVSAVGTVLISGVALWLSVRDRRVQLRATLSSGVIPQDNPSILNFFVYVTKIILYPIVTLLRVTSNHPLRVYSIATLGVTGIECILLV